MHHKLSIFTNPNSSAFLLFIYLRKKAMLGGCQWLTSVILATQEAEIRRIEVQSQPRQIVLEDPISKKKPITKKELVEWLNV
jgi:hypothetical protein